jgi:RNA polymerase sigma-70 factor (ECF subfamily)
LTIADPPAPPQRPATSPGALVERARARDEAAFEALFKLHRDAAYGLALRLTADPDEAEEVVAEAFAAAWFGLPDFAGRSAFGTWLHSILLNRARQRRRAADRRRRRVLTVADPEAWERAVTRTFPGTRIDVERAVAALPPRAREVTLLRHAAGFTYAEIADATGVTMGTVKSQLSRAYQLMRKRLSK